MTKLIQVIQNSQEQSEKKKFRALIIVDENKATPSISMFFLIEKNLLSDFDSTLTKRLKSQKLENND
jgi:hypothetical protein